MVDHKYKKVFWVQGPLLLINTFYYSQIFFRCHGMTQVFTRFPPKSSRSDGNESTQISWYGQLKKTEGSYSYFCRSSAFRSGRFRVWFRCRGVKNVFRSSNNPVTGLQQFVVQVEEEKTTLFHLLERILYLIRTSWRKILLGENTICNIALSNCESELVKCFSESPFIGVERLLG